MLSHELYLDEDVEKLKKLVSKLDQKSPRARIDFMVCALESGLYNLIQGNDLFDLGISSRDYDTCCEMGDGHIVIHGVMELP